MYSSNLKGATDKDVSGTGPYEVLKRSRADLPGVGLCVPSGEGAVIKGEGDCPGFSRLKQNLLETLEVLDGLSIRAGAREANVCLGDNSMDNNN